MVRALLLFAVLMLPVFGASAQQSVQPSAGTWAQKKCSFYAKAWHVPARLSLGIPVLAEGIETVQQLDLLRSEACDEGQGYYLGRPAPMDVVSNPGSTASTADRDDAVA